MAELENDSGNLFHKIKSIVNIHYINTDDVTSIRGVKKAYLDPSNTFVIFEIAIENGYSIDREVEYCKLSEIRNIFTFDK